MQMSNDKPKSMNEIGEILQCNKDARRTLGCQFGLMWVSNETVSLISLKLKSSSRVLMNQLIDHNIIYILGWIS